MVLGGKRLESDRPSRQPCRGVRLVNQHVAATTGIDRFLRRVRVARDDDTAIRRVEAVAVTLHGVLRGEGSHRHIFVLVDDARTNLVRIHVVALRECSLIAIGIGARLDVNTVGFEEMLSHSLEALGAIDLERDTTPNRPRGEDQVWVTDRMVRVKVGNERDAQPRRFECLDTFVEKRCVSAPHYSSTKVNEVGGVVDDDCRRRT